MLPKTWKESFGNGIVIPIKVTFCNECNDKRMSDKCNNQINENYELEGNLNLLKRKALNQFGHMLPYYKE